MHKVIPYQSIIILLTLGVSVQALPYCLFWVLAPGLVLERGPQESQFDAYARSTVTLSSNKELRGTKGRERRSGEIVVLLE